VDTRSSMLLPNSGYWRSHVACLALSLTSSHLKSPLSLPSFCNRFKSRSGILGTFSGADWPVLLSQDICAPQDCSAAYLQNVAQNDIVNSFYHSCITWWESINGKRNDQGFPC
jgi:hypothetical protein